MPPTTPSSPCLLGGYAVAGRTTGSSPNSIRQTPLGARLGGAGLLASTLCQMYLCGPCHHEGGMGASTKCTVSYYCEMTRHELCYAEAFGCESLLTDELLRTPSSRSSENTPSTHSGE